MADGKKSWRKRCVAQTLVFLIHIFTSNLSYFDQPSPRQMCEEFVRGGGSAQMNPSAHAPHVVTVLSIFDATPPHLLFSVKFSVQ